MNIQLLAAQITSAQMQELHLRVVLNEVVAQLVSAGIPVTEARLLNVEITNSHSFPPHDVVIAVVKEYTKGGWKKLVTTDRLAYFLTAQDHDLLGEALIEENQAARASLNDTTDVFYTSEEKKEVRARIKARSQAIRNLNQ